MKHLFRSLLPTIGLVFLTQTQATAQTFIPHPLRPPHYVVLDTRKITTVKEELTLIAMKGYRAMYVAPRPGNPLWPAGMTIILEKLPEGASAPEYALVEEKNKSAVHFLVDYASNGYRYVRNSAFTHRGHDFFGDFLESAVFGEKHVRHEKYDTFTNYILLELSKEDTPCLYRAQLTDPEHLDRSPKYHFAEGFRLIERIENQFIFEKCMESERPPEQIYGDFDEAAAGQRYQILATNDGKKRQKRLAEAVTNGFRISDATGNILCLVRNGMPERPAEYVSLTAKSETELEKKLNAAAGFRMISRTLNRRNNFWSGVEYRILMEKAERGAHFRYRVLREKNGNDVQDLLNQLHERHFEVREMTRDAGGITVLLEKTADSEIKPIAPEIPQEPRSELLLRGNCFRSAFSRFW